MTFSLPIIPLNKFSHKNDTLLIPLKKIKSLYYSCCIVGVLEKDNYCLLQYEVKNMYTYNFNQNVIKN